MPEPLNNAKFQYVMISLGIVADIALIINVIRHWNG